MYSASHCSAGTPDTKVPIEDPARIFEPRSLGLRLTYRCNSKCEHCYCYTDKDTLGAEELTFADIEPLLPEAKALGLTGIGVSGGEPFLLPQAIDKIVEHGKALGLNVNLATNAFWARHYDRAVETLERLKALGFRPPGDTIAVSAGQFHLPHIDQACAMHLIKAYRAVFDAPLPRVDFEYVTGNEQVLTDFRAYLAENGISEQDYKLVERTMFQTVGNATAANEQVRQNRPATVFQGLCPHVKDLIVEASGDVFPCCGFNRYNQGLVIGNIRRHSLQQIVSRAQVNPVMILLRKYSFAYLNALLARRFDMPEYADGLCDICENIFAKPEHIAWLVENFSHLYDQPHLSGLSYSWTPETDDQPNAAVG